MFVLKSHWFLVFLPSICVVKNISIDEFVGDRIKGEVIIGQFLGLENFMV